MNKKNAANLLKEHREKQKTNKNANKKIKPLLGIEDRLKGKRKAIEKLKDKGSPKRAREFVNSKKNEIYRRNARKKAIKMLTTSKKRKLRSVVKSEDNFLEAETISYAEPYRNTFTKKDEIFRKKAKKKTVKTLAKEKTETIPYVDENLSDAETIQYPEPYRDISKKDEIYRRKAKQKSIETLTKKSREKLKRKAPEIRIKNLPKKSKTDDPIEDVLEITAFKHISHPRTRKRLKEKSTARANCAMTLANIPFDPEKFLGVPLLFNLKMVSEFETED